jgi:hypothetical protein
MRKEEFNLSEKEYSQCPVSYFLKSDVKEFIRRLKEELDNKRGVWKRSTVKIIIDALAGKELCEK